MTEEMNGDRLALLRRQAEHMLRERSTLPEDFSEETIQQLLHELHVHQVELELQNQELREAQEKLAISHAKYVELYDFAPVGYLTINKDGLILEINLTGATMLGLERKQILNKPISRFVSPDTQDSYYFHHKRLLKTRQPQTCEVKLLRQDGTSFHARLESRPVPNEQGEDDDRYRIIISDVTSLKEAQTLLQEAHDELEQRVQQRTVELQAEISERKQAEETVQQRNRELTLLSRSARAFISSLDLDETLATVLGAARHLLGVTACRIWLIDSATGELVCRQADGPGNKPPQYRRLAQGEGLAGWVAQHGQSLMVADIHRDERQFVAVDQVTDPEVRSVLTIPLRVKETVIGVLQALDKKTDRFTEADLTLLEPLAATAAMAVENARLYKQAQQDAETRATLLREINHRVKNNLSIIIALLNAKRRSLASQTDIIGQAVIDSMITQVQGLATVHDLLSASAWRPLLLTELTEKVIYASLQVLARDNRIEIDVTPSPAPITAEQAHHLALVINELTTNAMKHALPAVSARNSNKLKITVRVLAQDDMIQLEFRDNGPGYPEHMLKHNPNHGSVGFELIENLVRRNLHGDLSICNNSGAITRLCFKAAVDQEKESI